MKMQSTEEAHPLYSEMITTLNERKIEDLQSIWAQYEHFQQVMNRDNAVKAIASEIGAASPLLLEQLESTYTNPIWKQRIAIWRKAQHWKQNEKLAIRFFTKRRSITFV